MIMPQLAPVRPDYISFDDTRILRGTVPRAAGLGDRSESIPTFRLSSRNRRLPIFSPDAAEDLTNVVKALESVT